MFDSEGRTLIDERFAFAPALWARQLNSIPLPHAQSMGTQGTLVQLKIAGGRPSKTAKAPANPEAGAFKGLLVRASGGRRDTVIGC